MVVSSMLDTSVLNMEIFNQIIEMDGGDPQHGFSRSVIAEFFQEARSTITKILASYPNDLTNISRLGHYLKGSSATVGLLSVEKSCQRIQYFANLRDPETEEPVTREVARQVLHKEILQVQALLEYCDRMLQRYF